MSTVHAVEKMNKKILIVAAVLVLVGFFLVIKASPFSGGIEHFRHQLLRHGPWAVVISTVLMIAQTTVAPMPGNPVAIVNGLVFGPLRGAALSWISSLIGASICFVLARTLGKPFVKKIVGPPLERAESFFGKYGLHMMFVARIVPFVPFDAISYIAGLAGVPYPVFLAATALGIAPSILMYSYLGSIATSSYWYLTIGAGGFLAIGAAVGALLFMRKTRNASFAETEICDNV